MTLHQLAKHLRERQIHNAPNMQIARELGIANFRRAVKEPSDKDIIESYLINHDTKKLYHPEVDLEYVKEQCERGRLKCFCDFDEMLTVGCTWYARRIANAAMRRK